MSFWRGGRASATASSCACAFQWGAAFPAQHSLSTLSLSTLELHSTRSCTLQPRTCQCFTEGFKHHSPPLPTFGYSGRCWASAMPGKTRRSCGCSESLSWSPWAECTPCQRPHCGEAGELNVLLEGSTANQWQMTMIPSPVSSFSFPLLTTHSDSKEMGAAGWDLALSFPWCSSDQLLPDSVYLPLLWNKGADPQHDRNEAKDELTPNRSLPVFQGEGCRGKQQFLNLSSNSSAKARQTCSPIWGARNGMPLKSSHVAKLMPIPTYRNSLSPSKLEEEHYLKYFLKEKKIMLRKVFLFK